jgi:hypothetical protein
MPELVDPDPAISSDHCLLQAHTVPTRRPKPGKERVMQAYRAQHLQPTPAEPMADERAVLLEEVDFKWLMAGQGWWIDTTRLHTDADYARQMFDLVDATPSATLKDCAALLQAHTGAQHESRHGAKGAHEARSRRQHP